MDLNSHPHLASLKEIAADYLAWQKAFRGRPLHTENFKQLINIYARFCAIYRHHPIEGIQNPEDGFPVQGSMKIRAEAITGRLGHLNQLFTAQKQTEDFEKAIEAEALKLKLGTIYEFTDDELARAQEFINDLRDLLANAKNFEEEHRRRILKKLDSLQAELHKKLSDFDFYLGRLVSVGYALGEFGEAAAPLIDRFRAVWVDAARIKSRTDIGQQLLSADEITALPKPDDQEAA